MKGYNQEFIFDEESQEVVRRYEQAVQNRSIGYFDVEELEVIVDYYLNCGKPKESSKAIDLGISLHPGSTALQAKRAKVYLASGEVRKAFQILKHIQSSNDSETELLKGEALLRLNHESEAHQVFSRLADNAHSDIPNLCLDIANVYIANGYYKRALIYLEKGLTEAPNDVDLLQEAAFCYEQTDKPDTAIQYYNRILDSDPYSVESWFNLGLVYLNQEKYIQALDAFDFVTVIDEEDFGGWLQKGNTLFHLNRFEESLDCYRRCENKVVYPEIIQIFMGECHEKLDDYASAKACYERAVEINPQNSEAWSGMGICSLELDTPEKSIEYLLKSLEFDSENFETWVYLAEAYVNTNRIKDAEKAYKKSLKLEQQQPDTWVALGNIYIDSMQYQSALDCYLEAFNQDSSLENINLFLAIAYYKLGELDKTLPLLHKALNLNPESSSIFLDICPDAKEILKH